MPFAVDGVRVGHWTDEVARTGCTVVVLPPGTVGSYEARGGVPAARELTALEPDKAVDQVDAVVLTGGSAFGLAAADGVVRLCEEVGRGVATPAGPVPIVPAMALYDLGVGDPATRPDATSGYLAARDAAHDPPLSGRVGAGTGACVGHWRGPEGRRPGGLGYAARREGDVVVAAVCAVNAFGDVLAGEDVGEAARSTTAAAALSRPFAVDDTLARTHTTIGVLVTNAAVNKVGCRVVAQGGHDGLARALHPPHTRYDGDALIAAATGQVDTAIDVVRLLALLATADAVRAVADPDYA